MIDTNNEYSEEKYVFYLELAIQRNLLLILKVADISVEKFAASLGVTAQTIRNLSAYETFISRTQFISIMSMLEMERRKGVNKEAVDTLLSTLFHSKLYKKYGNNFQSFSKDNIFGKDRKLSKKNSLFSTGVLATLGAFGIAANPLAAAAGAVGAAGITVSSALKKIDSSQNQLYQDIKQIEESNDKDTFSWMNHLYNVRDSLQNYKKYNDFIEELKGCKSTEEKGKLFDEYIAYLLIDLSKN